MPDRPPPKFKEGDRVKVPVLLMTAHRETTTCEGTIEGTGRWEGGDGGRPSGRFYGVDLDVGGGTLSSESRIKPLDVITKLGDLARD